MGAQEAYKKLSKRLNSASSRQMGDLSGRESTVQEVSEEQWDNKPSKEAASGTSLSIHESGRPHTARRRLDSALSNAKSTSSLRWAASTMGKEDASALARLKNQRNLFPLRQGAPSASVLSDKRSVTADKS